MPGSHLPGSGVNVGQQGIAHADGLLNGIINGLTRLSEVVNLPFHIRTVRTHHGIEQPELHPTYIQFLEKRIAGCTTVGISPIVTSGEKSTDVGIEIGVTCQREVQSGRNLATKCFPRRIHIARPCIGTGTLLVPAKAERVRMNTRLSDETAR